MEFEWDEAKAASNKRKHGVDFEDALQIFAGRVVMRPDDRRDYGEVRLIALGELKGCVLKVIFTRRGRHYRLISAWKANRRDQATYRANVIG
ncbi:MAG: BrnT family toxin [Rhodospirillaceae bacterium]|nr:BrnT family toxin [Rhodospirillaceae bacterium]